MSDAEAKPPIPREEPPPESDAARMLRLLEQINVKQDTLANTQSTHGTMIGGITTKLLEHDAAIKELQGGSNPPPRTASGFTAAVRQISQSTESEPDKATALQVAALATRLESIEAKTDLQTELLHTIVSGVGAFANRPLVQKIGKALAYVVLGILATYAATHGVSLK